MTLVLLDIFCPLLLVLRYYAKFFIKYKRLNNCLGQYFEDELVQGEKTYNPWALKCHRENLIKIGINIFKVSTICSMIALAFFITFKLKCSTYV